MQELVRKKVKRSQFGKIYLDNTSLSPYKKTQCKQKLTQEETVNY